MIAYLTIIRFVGLVDAKSSFGWCIGLGVRSRRCGGSQGFLCAASQIGSDWDKSRVAVTTQSSSCRRELNACYPLSLLMSGLCEHDLDLVQTTSYSSLCVFQVADKAVKTQVADKAVKTQVADKTVKTQG